jgi:RimJ/RimL family protein N-acetyltransferase
MVNKRGEEPHCAPSGVVCQTPRLNIRALTAADLDLYCELFTDADTMRHISPPLTRRRAARSFELALERSGRRPHDDLFLTLELKSREQSVGLLSVQQIDFDRGSAEAGVMILPAYRRAGIATEGLECALRWASAVLQLAEIWLATRHDHTAMQRLCARLQCSAPATREPGTGGAVQRRCWRPNAVRFDFPAAGVDSF